MSQALLQMMCNLILPTTLWAFKCIIITHLTGEETKAKMAKWLITQDPTANQWQNPDSNPVLSNCEVPACSSILHRLFD